ncbi:MAG: GGDEF domain-containing protein [Burkholderiaceae bacterium]|nr:GGDEF domain-containing protein [Burkholderiaceae bacterium]MCD6672524.1 GGDEF domain-containing protein [Burkholderiaceae bacterium]
MAPVLIVDMQTLWLISGVTVLTAAATLMFLRSLHDPSAPVLGLHALAMSLGGNALLVAGLTADNHESIARGVAVVGVGAAAIVGCEAVRRLYGAKPRPAMLFAFLFLLVAGTLGFDSLRSNGTPRTAYVESLVAVAAVLTAIRVARARDPAAEIVRRALVAAACVYALASIANAVLVLRKPLPAAVPATEVDTLGLVTMALGALVPMAITALMLAAVHSRMADELRAMATTDPLTRLLSRRVLFDSGEPLLASTRLSGRMVAAMMVDIDHFKQINDVYGHAAGDAVLRHCARQLRAGARAEALAARYGGEEFCLLVPIERERDAFVAAERLRHRIASQPCVVNDRTVQMTVSIGVAIHEHGQRLAQLLARADELLYAAKRAGRNRVVSADSPADQPDLALLVV